MRLNKCFLLCAILVLSSFEFTGARKSFGRGGGSHSYPKSGGLSGGGHNYPSSGGHGYPSGGLSGGGGHSYPSSGGLSGGGRGGYPSSGGSHGYPSSGGSHGYPSSNNGHGYPSSGGGLSGNQASNTHHTSNHGYPANKGVSGGTSVHHHYHYNPPQQISYTPVHGGPVHNYPVYRGTPPTYVYQYKDSGSKYGTLLAGLALLNLGALAGTAYAVSHSNSNSHSYKSQPGEVCLFGLKKDNGDYEETKIDCNLITSFIFQEQAKAPSPGNANNITTITTVTNVTTVTNGVTDPGAHPDNQTAPATNTLYQMLPNGTLVPVNVTATNTTVNGTSEPSPANNTTSSMTVTTTTTNTTTVNAVDVKGKEIEVTKGMQCFIIRKTPQSVMRKTIECGLLQTYAQKSLKVEKNLATRNTPVLTALSIVVAAYCVMF